MLTFGASYIRDFTVVYETGILPKYKNIDTKHKY